MRRTGPTGWAAHEALGHCPPIRRPALSREAALMRLFAALLRIRAADRMMGGRSLESEASATTVQALLAAANAAEEVEQRLDAMARGEEMVDVR